MQAGSFSTGGVSGGQQAWQGKKTFLADALNARGVLTGPITLLETDSEYQTMDCGGANRTVTLPTVDNQGLRFYISNVGIVGSIKLVDQFGNAIGSIPPQASSFIVCTTANGVQVWQAVSAETEIALQLRAVIMTAYFNQGQITPGMLEMNCKILGCTYTALQFMLAKNT